MLLFWVTALKAHSLTSISRNKRIVFDDPFDKSRENTEKRSLRRNQRSHLFSRDHALDVAMDIQIENYNRQAILLAK
jgi:hypothetical protein